MKTRLRAFLVILIALFLFLSGCSGNNTLESSATVEENLTSSELVSTAEAEKVTTTEKAPETEPVTEDPTEKMVKLQSDFVDYLQGTGAEYLSNLSEVDLPIFDVEDDGCSVYVVSKGRECFASACCVAKDVTAFIAKNGFILKKLVVFSDSDFSGNHVAWSSTDGRTGVVVDFEIEDSEDSVVIGVPYDEVSKYIEPGTGKNLYYSKSGFGKTITFDGFEVTLQEDYTFTVVENRFSENNGKEVVELPVHIKNVGAETGHLSPFRYKFFGPSGTEIDDISAYFDNDAFRAGDLRPGAEYDTFFHILYESDGSYYVEFKNYDERIELEILITKEKEEPPTTEAMSTEEAAESTTESEAANNKKVAHAFDSTTNKTYTAKGIEFQIPADWVHNDPYFYPCTDSEDFAMVYYSPIETASSSMLDNDAFRESYVNGMVSNMQNGKVIKSEIMEIAGRKMLVTYLEGELSDKDMELIFATMAAPEDGNLLVLSFGQRIHCATDYSADFMSILENLKDAKN